MGTVYVNLFYFHSNMIWYFSFYIFLCFSFYIGYSVHILFLCFPYCIHVFSRYEQAHCDQRCISLLDHICYFMMSIYLFFFLSLLSNISIYLSIFGMSLCYYP